MKLFNQLEFKPHPLYWGGQIATLTFDNGLKASVISGRAFMSAGPGSYELAVFHNNNVVGEPEGWLTAEDVDKHLQEIKNR